MNPTSLRRPGLPGRLRCGLATLWLGWALAGLALLLFGLTAASGRAWSLLTLRRNQALAASEDLASAFASLEKLPGVLAGTARDLAAAGDLSEGRLASLRAEGEPFCRLHWLQPGGGAHGGASDPEGPAPDWLWAIGQRRLPASGVRLLRSLPPGLEAGRLTNAQLELEADTPERYIAVAARDGGGGAFLAQLSLDHIYGAWLKKRLERSPLSDSLTVTPAAGWDKAVATSPPEPQRGGLLAIFDDVPDAVWTWSGATFFAQSQHPFPPLLFRLENRQALRALRLQVMAAGALAVGLMGAFAVAIFLTGRAVRRETEYAQARARFSETVSHELRTPLSAITMYAEILREGLVDDPVKQASYHTLLLGQTERLKRLVEDVLTFGRLEGGDPRPDWQLVRLADVAETATAAVAPLGGEIVVHSMESDCDLVCDRSMLEQILINLLENAVKYAGRAPIEISAAGSPSQVVVSVSDRGPGVPEKNRREIFEPYTRVQPADGPKRDGVGLGLAVVERLVHGLGGKIVCQARPGGGATFAVTLRKIGGG